MDIENTTMIILRGNFETLSNQRLQEVCAEVLVEFSGAIKECINPPGVRLKLISAKRDDQIDALWKIRGAINTRKYRARQTAREEKAAARLAELSARYSKPA